MFPLETPGGASWASSSLMLLGRHFICDESWMNENYWALSVEHIQIKGFKNVLCSIRKHRIWTLRIWILSGLLWISRGTETI